VAKVCHIAWRPTLLVRGKISTIDAGQLLVPGQAPRHFVHAATVGLNVSFAKLATQATLRRRFGRFTYVVAAAKALRQHQQFQCTLSYDDGRLEQLQLVHLSVINAPIFGGFLGLRISGGNLDDRAHVIAVEHLSVRRLLQAAAQPVLGISRPIPGIRTLRVAHLSVHTATPWTSRSTVNSSARSPPTSRSPATRYGWSPPKSSTTSKMTPTTEGVGRRGAAREQNAAPRAAPKTVKCFPLRCT